MSNTPWPAAIPTRTRRRAPRRRSTGSHLAERLEPRRLLASSFYVSTYQDTIDTVSATGAVAAYRTGLIFPRGLIFDASGNLYVTQIGTTSNILRITPGGTTTTFASGFDIPIGLAFDASGDLYVANYGSNTIDRVTPAGVVSTFATGLDEPESMTMDASGNLYAVNFAAGTMSKVTPAGVVSTFATGLDEPYGLTLNGSGDLFASSYGTGVISEVTPAGIVTQFASGLAGPCGLVFDAAGNLYCADLNGNAISEISPAGVVSTFATGLDQPEFFANSAPVTGVPALSFESQPVNQGAGVTLPPVTVAVTESGNVLTTDTSAVTVAIATGPAGATLSGTATVSAVRGVATFSNLSINLPGTYTLSATDGTDVAATSSAVTLTPVETIGGLDPHFGTAGLASHDVGFTSTAGVAADGTQSVLVGPIGTSPNESFGVTRYNADGSLDTTFGTAGVTTTPFAGTDAVPAAVAVLSDGDILVAGTATTYAAGAATGSACAVAEYTAAGALNPAFGTAGQLVVSFSTTAGALSNDLLRAVAVGPGGVIYLGGSSDGAGKGNTDLAVAALTPAGALETTFGTAGKTLVDVAGGDDGINGLAVQRNGDLVAAGSATVSGVSEIALARFLTTGALDPRFGTKGLVTDKVGTVYDAATSVVVQTNGAIVVGGLTATGSGASLSSDFVVQRYTTAGRLDRTFGTAGTAVTSFSQPAAVTQVVLASSGEIVASGKTTASLASVTPDTLDVAIARYTTRGALDTTFNATGKVIINLAVGVVAASTAQAPSRAVPGQTMVPLSLAAADAAATLSAAFDAFTSSEQGVVAVTQGGEILSAGNSGADTVEAELIAAGVDLIAKLLSSLPASVLAGLKATATVSISEGGTTPAVGAVTLTLSVATDAAGDGATTVKTLGERVNLKQGQARTYKVPFAYPATASGGYYLLASVTDGSPLPADLNPANNTAASPATVDVAPAFISLGGSALATSPTLNPGAVATVSLDITNDGNVTAKGRIALDLLLSTDATAADGTQIAGLPVVVGLAPGKSKGLRLSFKLAAGFRAGTYDLIALVDPTDGLGSGDRTNAVVVDASPVTVS